MMYKYLSESPFYINNELIASKNQFIDINNSIIRNVNTDASVVCTDENCVGSLINNCKLYITDIKGENNVDHPTHYNQGGIECIDAMEAAYGTEVVIAFCMCNAFKYQWRFNSKNGREDILKSQWYQNKMIELQNKLKKNA